MLTFVAAKRSLLVPFTTVTLVTKLKNDAYCMHGHCAMGFERYSSHGVPMSVAAKMEHHKSTMHGHRKIGLENIW